MSQQKENSRRCMRFDSVILGSGCLKPGKVNQMTILDVKKGILSLHNLGVVFNKVVTFNYVTTHC